MSFQYIILKPNRSMTDTFHKNNGCDKDYYFLIFEIDILKRQVMMTTV